MKNILGVYSQLPFGCDRTVLEAVLLKTLKPLLTDLYTKPLRRLLIHLSVNELEFLEHNYPELNMLMYDLCKKGQLEFIAGSYYDVMLPLIPAHERSIQIEKTTTYLRKRFGRKPKGMWCLGQYFSPSLLPLLSMSSLEYIVISPYSQAGNTVGVSKPFYMDDVGKSAIILPFDDRFSKEVYDFNQSKITEDKLVINFQKLCASTRDSLDFVMLNLDQLVKLDNPSRLFDSVYDSFENEFVLPSNYLEDVSVSRTGYLPWGVYGRDLDLGKNMSINQGIIDNSLKYRYFSILNFFRETTKDLKKNSVERIKLETALVKANSSSIYINGNYKDPRTRIEANKYLSEMESILANGDLLPQTIDINSNRTSDFIAVSKNNVAYINPKGAVISRLSVANCSWDIMNHCGEGLFSESFTNISNGKTSSVASKKFEISCLDKKKTDFIAVLSSIELGTSQINLIKRFKFRQNAVIVEFGIENTGNSPVEGFMYNCELDMFLSESCELFESDKEEAQDFSFGDKSIPFTVNFWFSDNVIVESKHIYQNVKDCLGDRQLYQYTQINIKKRVSLKPIQEDHLSLAMKIEKRKEKR